MTQLLISVVYIVVFHTWCFYETGHETQRLMKVIDIALLSNLIDSFYPSTCFMIIAINTICLHSWIDIVIGPWFLIVQFPCNLLDT